MNSPNESTQLRREHRGRSCLWVRDFRGVRSIRVAGLLRVEHTLEKNPVISDVTQREPTIAKERALKIASATGIAVLICAALAYVDFTAALTDDTVGSESRDVAEVRARIDEYRSLSASFDPALARLYRDSATIALHRIGVDGEKQKQEFKGEAYKELLLSSLEVAKAAGDRSLYLDPQFSEAENKVQVTLTRYSEKKHYTAPHSMTFEKSEGGAWLIAKERIELRQAPGNAFVNLALGFSIRKPEKWEFKSAAQLRTSHAGLELRDKDLESSLKQGSRAPFVVIMNETESEDSVYPTFQARARVIPKGQLSEVEFLQASIAQLQKSFDDLKILQEPEALKISGLAGAAMTTQYTLKSGDHSFPVVSELRVVRRNNVLFILGLSRPPGTNDDYSKIWDSVRIETGVASKREK